MGRKKKYKNYDAAIKAAISVTGKTDLFPELNIPRTTASYWIKRRFKIADPDLVRLTDATDHFKSECEVLRRSLREKDALIKLLQFVVKTLGFKLQWTKVEPAEVRSRILDAVSWAMETTSREQCLSMLGLSLTRYKRWRRERRICGFTGQAPCPRGKVNQLTFNEVQTMKNLVTSKEFAHFPIRSLHYYALREGLLFCSYSTWRKYIDQFGWKRIRKESIEKKERSGFERNSQTRFGTSMSLSSCYRIKRDAIFSRSSTITPDT